MIDKKEKGRRILGAIIVLVSLLLELYEDLGTIIEVDKEKNKKIKSKFSEVKQGLEVLKSHLVGKIIQRCDYDQKEDLCNDYENMRLIVHKEWQIEDSKKLTTLEYNVIVAYNNFLVENGYIRKDLSVLYYKLFEATKC